MPKKSELAISAIKDKNYTALLKAAKSKIISTHIKIAKTACKEQIELYWWLGQQIVRAQEKHGWGKSVVEQLSTDIRRDFEGTMTGFSARNLWDMRRFYLEYRNSTNLRQLVAEIAWGQNLLILNKVKDDKAREYYLQATRDMGGHAMYLNYKSNLKPMNVKF